MAKAHIKFFGTKLEWHNLSGGAAMFIVMLGLFALLPLQLWIIFLVARWAIDVIFQYHITGTQFVAAAILGWLVSLPFKREGK